MTSGKKSLTDRIWTIFTSVRLTITLVLCIMALSILGTIIAQQGTTQVPIENLYKPQTLKWLVYFGFTDIYHSMTFVFLLLMLAMNLIICSIERLPKVWREAFHVAPPPVGDPTLREWTPEEAKLRKYLLIRLGHGQFQSAREAKMAAMLFFQKQFGRYVVLRDSEDQFQLMVEKDKYSRLGVYITHLSLLMIMFGGATGAIVGFEGGMSIDEGSRQSWMQHIKGSKAGMKTMMENGAPVPGFLNLGFEVECEKFTLETYDGERPKAFKSILNFYENDVKTYSAEIAVNHPTEYRGITFYQASFAKQGVGSADVKVYRIADAKKTRNPSSATSSSTSSSAVGGFPQLNAAKGPIPSLITGGAMPKIESVELVHSVRPNDLYRIDGNAAFKVTQLEENLMDLGPAAKIQYFASRSDKKPEEFWIFKSLPGFDFAHRRNVPLNFVLDQVNPKFATGLSVARDPGVWIVWIGSAILILALFLALYTCHSRYWVAYTKEEGFVVVGWSNKLFLFEPRYEKFRAAFQETFKL
jgi:cytochrome c biogenesis protein